MASFPSPGYWIPLPAGGSGPPVLHRHWTPGAFRALPLPLSYWIPTSPNGSGPAALERHWASDAPFTPHAHPAGASGHDGETEMLAAECITQLDERLSLANETVTPIAGTVAAAAPPSSAQTVTRLCIGCGKPLVGKRPQAKAHGAACRQRAYRLRKKAAGPAQSQSDNGRDADQQLAGLAHATAR